MQVEPFSVKHEYEAPWDPVKPSLETCHPGRMQYVTHGLAPQMVEEGEEVIFSYDVVFKMSNIRCAAPPAPRLASRECAGAPHLPSGVQARSSPRALPRAARSAVR